MLPSDKKFGDSMLDYELLFCRLVLDENIN